MQRAGLYALLLILGFALIFAFMPTGNQAQAQTGATLNNVELKLYPSQDPSAIWSFKAQRVTHDPVNSETRLTGISDGQRLLQELDQFNRLTGRWVKDATLSTPELVIDGRDDLTTRQARITLIKECADIGLTGTEKQPVKIEQGYGFNAAVADLDSPSMSGQISGLRMSFQFNIDGGKFSKTFKVPLDPTETCRDGKRVPITATPPSKPPEP